MGDENNDRLNRIETKLDNLFDYMSAFARVEERVSNLEENCKKTQELDTRLSNTEQKVEGFIRIFWVIIKSVVAILTAATISLFAVWK